MPIWELMPSNKQSDHWKASTFKGCAIVRASSEEEARSIASLKFRIATRRFYGADTLFSPWDQPALVTCQRLENSGYKESGPTEILCPEEGG